MQMVPSVNSGQLQLGTEVGSMQATGRHRKPASELLTVSQAAALLNVHPNTVRRWSQNGEVKAYRIGSRGDRRFHRADVERLLRSSPW